MWSSRCIESKDEIGGGKSKNCWQTVQVYVCIGVNNVKQSRANRDGLGAYDDDSNLKG